MNKRNNHRYMPLLMAGLVVVGVGRWAHGQVDGNDVVRRGLADQINDVFRSAVVEVTPAVVYIQASRNLMGVHGIDALAQGAGTGFIVDKRGYIVTNSHVVAGSDEVEVELADGRKFVAQEILIDEDSEIAVVGIDPEGQDLPVTRFGDSEKSRVGDTVLAIGNPFGHHFSQTVTMGIISHKARRTGILDRNWGYEDFIQTDADINVGNSGGPLVNLYGEVIGINTMIVSHTGVSAGLAFAIPSNIASFVAGELIEHKKVRRGYLGVRTTNDFKLADLRQHPIIEEVVDDNELAAVIRSLPDSVEGAVIMAVRQGAPAERAGMKTYDVVTELAGREIRSARELHNFTATLLPGSRARCLVWRDGEEIELQITLGDREEAKALEIRQLEIVTEALRAAPRLIDPKKPKLNLRRGKLGVLALNLSDEVAKEFGHEAGTAGVVIIRVRRDSLADKKGLETGDIIVSIDGEKVKNTGDLVRMVRGADLDDEGIEMRIRNRGGSRTLLIVEPEE